VPHGDKPVYSKVNSKGNADYYAVIRDTDMTAIITEFGYIDSKDREKFDEEHEIETQAIAITKGICKFYNIVYIDYKEDEEDMVRYKKLLDIPNDYGFRDIINKLMNAKIITGDGSDKKGNNDVIDLSYDQVRTLMFLYRGGAFDKKLMAEGLEPVVK
jgi:hypothetical protein